MLGASLERACADPIAILVKVGEAADIDDPQIHRRFAGLRPLCENPARAAGARNAEGIEAGTDIEILQLRRRAQNEISIRREAFRPVDHLLDAGIGQGRHAGQGLAHMLLEMIPVIFEQLEFEIVGHVAKRPGDRVRLIAAEDEATDLFLEIGAPVGIADRRHIGGKSIDLLGDHILMLHRLQWHGDTSHRTDLTCPLPAAIDDRLAGNAALIGDHRDDTAFLDFEAFDADAFDEPRAMHARSLGERLGDVGRACLPVGRQEGRADEIACIEQRPELLRLVGESRCMSMPKLCAVVARRLYSVQRSSLQASRRQPVIFQPVSSPVSLSRRL